MIPTPPPPPETVVVTPIILPLPLVLMQGGVQVDNIRIGPTRHEVQLTGGYLWNRNYYYDPKAASPAVVDTTEGQLVTSNRWELRGAWGWQLRPDATLFLNGYGLLGGPNVTGSYDNPLAGGASVLGGPLLRVAQLDNRGFPTRGWQVSGAYGWGRHWGGAAFDFQRASLDMMRFLPLGADATLAVRGVTLSAWPQLAWLDKFSAGGGQFIRGFQWNRFTGDQLVAATIEHRWRFEPDLLGRLGVGDKLPVKIGLASAAFVDAGRAWESRKGLGLPFPRDLRFGVGAGLIALMDGAPAGRLELSFSAEGFFPVASGGAAF